MIKRPRLISKPDQITSHQQRSLDRRALGEGRHLQHRIDLAVAKGEEKILLEDQRYILEKTLVLNPDSKIFIVGCHFQGTPTADPLIYFPKVSNADRR